MPHRLSCSGHYLHYGFDGYTFDTGMQTANNSKDYATAMLLNPELSSLARGLYLDDAFILTPNARVELIPHSTHQ